MGISCVIQIPERRERNIIHTHTREKQEIMADFLFFVFFFTHIHTHTREKEEIMADFLFLSFFFFFLTHTHTHLF